MIALMVLNGRKGFTLVEIIFVIIILGLLATLAIAKYVSFAKDAEHASFDSVMGSLSSALTVHSAQHLVGNQPITTHDPFDDLSSKPSNYAGAFPDVTLANCPPGYWAYQSGAAANGNWAVLCYRAKATLTQAFSWSGAQWIVVEINEVQENGVTVGFTLDYYPPAPIW
jgi:prepilin-type N-terminal cleavage/methylation domain-containing protein